MAVSFARDIRPLFTEVDIAHMKGFGVLLDDFDYMRDPAHAQRTLDVVSAGGDAAKQQRRAALVARQRPALPGLDCRRIPGLAKADEGAGGEGCGDTPVRRLGGDPAVARAARAAAG